MAEKCDITKYLKKDGFTLEQADQFFELVMRVQKFFEAYMSRTKFRNLKKKIHFINSKEELSKRARAGKLTNLKANIRLFINACDKDSYEPLAKTAEDIHNNKDNMERRVLEHIGFTSVVED